MTIGENIAVDLPGMASAEDGFRHICYAFQATLDELDRELQAGLAEWDGEAKAAYLAAHAQWRAAAADMARNLAWLHGVIRTAGRNYGSARGASLSMWGGR